MPKITLLDGAMGTMIQAAGVKVPAVPEELNITHPELIEGIQKKYVEAGSDVIYANTFTANRYKASRGKYSVDELITAGINIAKNATKGTKTKVALDIGPIGRLLLPNGDLSFAEAYDMYKEMLIAGAKAGADLVVFETSTDLLEMKAAVLAAKENTDLPIWSTMTFEENGRTFTGVSVASMAVTLSALDVDALGINCSIGPDKMLPNVEELMRYTDKPVIVKPNAGLPDLITGGYDIGADDFAEYMKPIIECGVSIIGGCCGSDPEFIRKLRGVIDENPEIRPRKVDVDHSDMADKALLASSSQVVVVDRPRVVGERINPTGKKLFKEALKKHDISYICGKAVEQVNGGADILDVNVGLPEIDEKAMMVDVVTELQGVVDAPLQLDSTEPAVLEAALRIYNGKPLVNSVNGKKEVYSAILPLVKKYGASVIGLTIDESGIPDKAEDRFKIAEKIVNAAKEYGISEKDIYIDCLVMSASVKQAEVRETLKAVSMVKEKLHVHTLLGVSNISFGLPIREYINTSFLTMALAAGLDLPIMNPNNEAMMAAVKSFRVLYNIDENCEDYVNSYAGKSLAANKLVSKDSAVSGNGAAAVSDTSGLDNKAGLSDIIIDKVRHGLKNGIREDTAELLKTMPVMDVVNNVLIHALDLVGDDYEKNIIFLPQLLQAAGAAQEAFDVIKTSLSKSDAEQTKKGTIVICTVKGDIHDIGKNIVKVILENYGYDVIDLGKDVPEEAVVEAAKKYNAGLVGLSALMTTTVVNMDTTIKAIKAAGLTCKIMVGGAVMTPEYAKQIHADYYAKDAKMSADIAKEVFGK